jgi:hypothetical protein
MALTTLIVACEPTPTYPVPEQPIVGEILEEQSALVTANGQPIVLRAYAASLSIPTGAYPAGTRVTLRLVNSLPMPADTSSSYFGYPQSECPVQAVQVLPAQPSPAQPLQLVLFGGVQSLSYTIFHAREGELTWTNTGLVLLNTSAGMSVAISEPGLWTAGNASSSSSGGSRDGGRD